MKDFYNGSAKVLFMGAIAIAAVVTVLRIFFVDVAMVAHDGMAPTLLTGERVAVWRSHGPFESGDVVICGHPAQPGRFVVGRIIGSVGDTIDANRGQLHINGHSLSVDLTGPKRLLNRATGLQETMVTGIEKLGGGEHEFMARDRTTLRISSWKLRRGFFLLGDNRSFLGEDSRSFGEVDPATCRGFVFMRLTPGPKRGDDMDNGYLDLID